MTGSMAGVVKSMDSAMRSMNLEKVCQCPEKHLSAGLHV